MRVKLRTVNQTLWKLWWHLTISSKWKSCRPIVAVYLTHERVHFHIVGAFCLFLRWYLKMQCFLCLWKNAQKNQSAGGIKRSKHDYCNSFNNETIMKLLYEFRNSFKVLIHHGILVFLISFKCFKYTAGTTYLVQ